MFRTLLLVSLVSSILGCATTSTGKAFDYVENDQILEAIPHFEKGIEEGERTSSLMLALLYSSDNHVPRDIAKAQQYLDLFSNMEPTLYDQALNYYAPFVQCVVWLKDEDVSNDQKASDLLKQQNFQSFSPVLSQLADDFTLGRDAKNNRLAKLLYLEIHWASSQYHAGANVCGRACEEPLLQNLY